MKLLFENWRQYLNEEQLLIEGRIEDVKKKYPDLDEKGLLDILIDKDPSGNQKYLAWAAKQLSQREDPTSQTANYAAANIELYHKLRAYIPSEYKDINRIKDLRDLERVASDTYQEKAEKGEMVKTQHVDTIRFEDVYKVVEFFHQRNGIELTQSRNAGMVVLRGKHNVGVNYSKAVVEIFKELCFRSQEMKLVNSDCYATGYVITLSVIDV